VNSIGARLASVQNPNAQRFLEIVGAFDDTWRINLESFLAENGRKDAIDSIMANRNQIVHGKDSGITLVRVNQYLEKCVEVIDFLEAQCGGTSQ
jgi:RiboL-PSP-HEPN